MSREVPSKEKLLLCFSGGKDSALGLWEIERCGQYEITALLTTVTAEYDRISMHGVRRGLLEQQAKATGYPLEQVLITADGDNAQYEARMREVLERYRDAGVRKVAFGDLFLEDVRRYREDNLAKVDMEAVFPLWGRATDELAQKFIEAGFRAVITCVDSQLLDGRFVGRDFDRDFLTELPAGVDACGENGEFHSFVYAGPIFNNFNNNEAIGFSRGETVVRGGRFHFCDLLPA
ncbi:MAG: ATP-binding protein [Actinobacteria bacterium]|nr:ATP-binding protein [Actinomycetota bacterium]